MLDNKVYKEFNCKTLQLPEDITITITPTMKIEKVVAKVHTYKNLGIQVIHFNGYVNRLIECGEFLAKVSKDISFFIDEPKNCPKVLRKYMENC